VLVVSHSELGISFICHLNNIFQVAYGENIVKRMMTGKAFRGHMLVDCSLTSLLLAEVFGEQRKGSKR
jgi:hypothetical protein